MLGCFFMLAFVGVALYGFAHGSFATVILSAVLFIFGIAAWGMDGGQTHRTSYRPNAKAPGKK